MRLGLPSDIVVDFAVVVERSIQDDEMICLPRTVVQYQLAKLGPVARSRLKSGGSQGIAVVKAPGPSHIDDPQGIEQFLLRQNIDGFASDLLQDCRKQFCRTTVIIEDCHN